MAVSVQDQIAKAATGILASSRSTSPPRQTPIPSGALYSSACQAPDRPN